jgi:hypothetical protein
LIPKYKVDAIMNLVYEYSRIMDGLMSKEGEARAEARSAANAKDREIRNTIKQLGLPRRLRDEKL